MNNSAIQIEWNPENKKEIEDAKIYYIEAKKKGRLITDLNNNAIEFFHPSLGGIVIKETELKDFEFSMRIFDKTGDRRLIWNSKDPNQIKEASNLFEDYISRGWRAYAVDEKGHKKRRIYKFDVEKEEIHFKDKSWEEINENFIKAIKKESEDKIKSKIEILSEFVKRFKKIELLPKTYPG